MGQFRAVRVRLTMLYGCLFLMSGAGLLAITYALVDNGLSSLRVSSGPPPGPRARAGIVTAHGAQGLQQPAVLHQILIQSGIALAIMAVVSVALGWLMAGRALRPLRVTLTRLDAAYDSQRRFVANASHELRTPLMVTRMTLQVALADPGITLGSLRAACAEVLDAGAEQERLIAALLTLARSQRGLDHREPVDLARVARRVLDAHEPWQERLDVSLSPGPVTGDPRLIEILVANLLENAARHNVPGGHIYVETGPRGTLTVSNSGPLVRADQVELLLQPFHHDGGGGLGLGLSIVAAIAEAHSARLSLCPRPAGGLTVIVDF